MPPPLGLTDHRTPGTDGRPEPCRARVLPRESSMRNWHTHWDELEYVLEGACDQ